MTTEDLKKLVAVMRELGVTQCDGVVLGPEPYPRKNAPGILKDWEAPPDDAEAEPPKRQTIEEFRKKVGC